MNNFNIKTLCIVSLLLCVLLSYSQGGPVKTSKTFTGYYESGSTSYRYEYELKYQLQSAGYGERPSALKIGISNFTIRDFKYEGQKAVDVLGTNVFGNLRAQATVTGTAILAQGQKTLIVDFVEPEVSNGGLDIYYFTAKDINHIKAIYGESITYNDLDVRLSTPELSQLAIGKVSDLQNALSQAKQASFQKKLDDEMSKERKRVKDELKVQEQIAKNMEEERKRKEKDEAEQKRIDEMLADPNFVSAGYSPTMSTSSIYTSERQKLQIEYENLLDRQRLERQRSEAMGQAIGDVVMNIANAIIEDSARREAQRQADAERRRIIQKQTNLRLKEELKSHNEFMQKRLDVLESNRYSLSNMLKSIEQEKPSSVHVVLVNYNFEKKSPSAATISLPYIHSHISYFEEPVKMPVTEIYTSEYKTYIDKFNSFYVETIDTDKIVTRQSYYFKTKAEAEKLINLIENLIETRSDYVSWTTMTTENYNPLNFQLVTGKTIQKDKPYQDEVLTKNYDTYDPTSDANTDEITTTQSVLDRYMTIVGGREKLQSIKSSFIKGKMTAQGVTLDVEIKRMNPSFASQTLIFNGFEAMKEVSNGEKGYQIQAGVRSDLPQVRINELSNTSLIPKLKPKNADGNAKKRKEDGIDTYMVKYDNSKEYYSLETGLLVKEITTVNGFNEGSNTVIYYSDYRDVDGVKIPFNIKTSMQDGDISIELKTVQFNKEVSKSDFKI